VGVGGATSPVVAMTPPLPPYKGEPCTKDNRGNLATTANGSEGEATATGPGGTLPFPDRLGRCLKRGADVEGTRCHAQRRVGPHCGVSAGGGAGSQLSAGDDHHMIALVLRTRLGAVRATHHLSVCRASAVRYDTSVRPARVAWERS
jgi:hypothetical protein